MKNNNELGKSRLFIQSIVAYSSAHHLTKQLCQKQNSTRWIVADNVWRLIRQNTMRQENPFMLQSITDWGDKHIVLFFHGICCSKKTPLDRKSVV